MTKRAKHLTRGRVVAGAAALAVVATAAMAMRPNPLPVETMAARVAPLRVTIDADGRTRVHDRYVVTAPITGRLERVPLEEGALVRAGDVVARIAPTPADAPAAMQARARLDGARALSREAAHRVELASAALAQARRDADRTRRLLDAGALAPRDLEGAELAAQSRADELVSARSRAAAAEADVAHATAALLYAGGTTAGTTHGVIGVRAPADGRVLRLAERSERVVTPGAMIAEIGDTRGLEVVADVLSSDAARVRTGMPVLLDGWGEIESASGHVRSVEPAATTRVSALGVEEQRVNVLIDVPRAPEALGDGFRVDVRIIVWESGSALTVPASALVRDGDGWAAYVVERGRARLRALRIGHLGGASAEVLDGVRAGEAVILFPSDRVQPGVRVSTR